MEDRSRAKEIFTLAVYIMLLALSVIGNQYHQKPLYAQSIASADEDRLTEGLPFIELDAQPMMPIPLKKTLTVFRGDERLHLLTGQETVEEAMIEAGIELKPGDRVFPSLYSLTQNTDHVVIMNFKEEEITKEQSIPFTSEERSSEDYLVGERITQSQGQDGKKQIVTKRYLRDDVILKEELIGEKVIQEPTQEVILVGTKEPIETVSLSGDLSTSDDDNSSTELYSSEENNSSSELGFSYSYYIDCTATAYDASVADGIPYTASGTIARPGVIAVDPSVIPLGTSVYIESLDGWSSYGYAVAEDTGSAIVGNIVDLFYDSHQTALDFGRRPVRVYILN